MVPNTPTPDTGATGDRLDSAALPLADHGEVLASGLTKRELFAAMAMQGILANGTTGATERTIVTASVSIADALIGCLATDPEF